MNNKKSRCQGLVLEVEDYHKFHLNFLLSSGSINLNFIYDSSISLILTLLLPIHSIESPLNGGIFYFLYYNSGTFNFNNFLDLLFDTF